MTITYLSGSKDDTTKTGILGVDVALGDSIKPAGSTVSNTAGDELFGVDVSQGTAKKSPNIHNSTNNTAVNTPSGYTIGGLPTYGDGKTTVTTTWDADAEVTGKGNLVIALQKGASGYNYGSLAN